MSARHKSEVHAWINAAIMAATSPSDAPHMGRSALVVIDEVTEGNWGVAGRTISLNSVAGGVGLPRDGDRFAWVQAYFAAKRRQLAAAGFPPDVGGLMAQDIVGSQ